MSGRAVILGLDSATLDLVEPWVQEGRLPHFQYLMEHGAWGRLESTIPPVTAVAWNTFATGKDPGRHGVFDFVRREEDGYQIRIVNGANRRAKPFWYILDHQGFNIGIMNMPMTYPPDTLRNGFMIAGFDAPGFTSDFVRPAHLKETLRASGYVIAPLETTREAWARSLVNSFQVQKDTFLRLKDTQPWDVLLMVFMQLDAAQHLFWDEMVSQDPDYGEIICKLYQMADILLGQLLDEIDENTSLIVLSDHGAGSLQGVVSLNRWLAQEGYLTLKQEGFGTQLASNITVEISKFLKKNLPRPVKDSIKTFFPLQDMAESFLLSSRIDWDTTQAFSVGEYGGVFINLKGREAKGIVAREQYEGLREEIIGKLSSLRDSSTGIPIFQGICRREELYSGPYLAEAPDLVPLWDYRYECQSRIERITPETEIFMNEGQYIPFTDTVKTGSHRPEGILFLHGPAIQSGTIKKAHLQDIIPTLFHIVGCPVPNDMDGRVLREAFKSEWLSQHPIVYCDPDGDSEMRGGGDYEDAEQARVEERLRHLGYLD